MSAPRVVLGLDPGLASLGWGLVEVSGRALTHKGHGCFRTAPQDGADLHRALYLAGMVSRLLESDRVDVVAAESWRWYGGHLGGGRAAHQLGLVLGAIARACEDREVTLTEAGRAQDWRHALGLPRTAKKGDVAERVRAVLGLREVPTPEHAADSLACAVVTAGRLLPVAGRVAA